MRHPYLCVYLHFVWATRDREPLLTPEREAVLYAAIRAKCEDTGCPALAVGGTKDHVHLLVRFSATLTIADFMKHIKGSTSHLLNQNTSPDAPFRWQGAYGILAVERSRLPIVMRYIQHQKEHHAAARTWSTLERTDEDDAVESGL